MVRPVQVVPSLVGKRRLARGSALVQLAMNTTNVKLADPTRPVTCQQPSVGKKMALDQKLPPGTLAKGVSGSPLLIRARNGDATAVSSRWPSMVSSPSVPTVHHGYFWLVEPSGSGVPPRSMPA